jgi:Na+/melibiose symporter-like transporter
MLILGLLLEAIRFNANLPAQSLFTVRALGLILPIGCLIAFVCAYAAYARYPLTKPMVDEAQEAIDAGRFESNP